MFFPSLKMWHSDLVFSEHLLFSFTFLVNSRPSMHIYYSHSHFWRLPAFKQLTTNLAGNDGNSFNSKQAFLWFLIFLLHLCWNCLQAALLKTCCSLAGQSAPAAAGAAALCKASQAEPSPVPRPARTAASGCQHHLTCWLLRAASRCERKREEANSRQVSTFPVLPTVSVGPRCWAPPAQGQPEGDCWGDAWVVFPGCRSFTSNLTMNASRDGAFTTSLGNQCFTTFYIKNYFLVWIYSY